jgi:rhodanese-related sulfurtransferase
MWIVYGVAWLGNASGSVRPILGMEPETFLNVVFNFDATATLLAWGVLVFFARHNRRALYLCSLVSVVILAWILFASPLSPINPRVPVRTGITAADYVKSYSSAMRDGLPEGGKEAHFPVPINSALVRQAKEEGALVLDLRSRDEFEGEHVPDALNVPFEEFQSRVNEIPHRELTVLIFAAVEDPERPSVLLKPTKEELAPVLRELVLTRGGYVGMALGGLDAWKSAGYQTVGRNVRLMDAEKFKRAAAENVKAWDGFLKAREGVQPGGPQ